MCFCEFSGISRIYLKFVAPRLRKISEAVYDWNQLRVKQNPAHDQIYLDSLMVSSFNRISNYQASSNPRICFAFTTMHHKAKLSQWITKEKSFPSWCIWADADTCQHWHVPLSKLTRPLHQFHVCVVSLSSGLQCKRTLFLHKPVNHAAFWFIFPHIMYLKPQIEKENTSQTVWKSTLLSDKFVKSLVEKSPWNKKKTGEIAAVAEFVLWGTELENSPVW